MNSDIERIKSASVPILKKAGVKKSAVFGSTVRGDATDGSDIDILVDLPRGKTLLDLAELQYSLEDALGRDVDVLTYRSVSPLLRESIYSNQVRIL